jgi:flavodoxin
VISLYCLGICSGLDQSKKEKQQCSPRAAIELIYQVSLFHRDSYAANLINVTQYPIRSHGGYKIMGDMYMIKNKDDYIMPKRSIFFLLLILLLLPLSVFAAESDLNKTLIVYYSLTGNTRTSCEALQGTLGADIVEIKDLKKRSGKWGFFKTAIASLFGKHTKIEPENPNFSPYANIILASPIWTGKLSMAIRTLIDKNRFDEKKVVIFTTTNAFEKEKYKEKARKLVRKAGGDVVGYYQILAKEKVNDKKIDRTKGQIIEDTLALVPEIKKLFFLEQ